MPLVRIYMRPGCEISDDHLELASEEIVPACYHTKRHPLTPGSIQFVKPVRDCSGLKDDVFVETVGFFYHDRAEIIDEERAPLMGRAFEELFPGVTFAVWPTLVTAGYWADSVDPSFDGDMSMPAAIERARAAIGAAQPLHQGT